MAEEVAELSIDTLPMPEYNKAREAGELTVKTAPEVDEKEPVEDKEEKPKAKGGFQKRIDRLVKHNAQLEEKLAKLEAGKPEPKTEQTPKVEGEPKLEDFKTHEEWVKATARWEARQELKAEREALQRSKDEEITKSNFDAHNIRVSEARARYDDFDEVTNITLPWKEMGDAAKAFQVALLEDENSAEIMYFFGKHPEELEKLATQSAVGITKAIARISDKLAPAEEDEEEAKDGPEEKKEPIKLVSKAKPPIKPVTGGTTKSTVPLDQMGMDDYRKARDAGRRA